MLTCSCEPDTGQQRNCAQSLRLASSAGDDAYNGAESAQHAPSSRANEGSGFQLWVVIVLVLVVVVVVGILMVLVVAVVFVVGRARRLGPRGTRALFEHLCRSLKR